MLTDSISLCERQIGNNNKDSTEEYHARHSCSKAHAAVSSWLREQIAERCAELEHENAALKERVESATGTTRQMLDRVRFIRQQTQATAGSDR